VKLPWRLRRLPSAPLAPPTAARLVGCDVRCAADPLARLIGLAGLRSLPADAGLLLPRTRSVHSFGMRFALDLLWLDGAGLVMRVDLGVPPRRLRSCRRAVAVVELPSPADA